jgi:hypothetical protein
VTAAGQYPRERYSRRQDTAMLHLSRHREVSTLQPDRATRAGFPACELVSAASALAPTFS